MMCAPKSWEQDDELTYAEEYSTSVTLTLPSDIAARSATRAYVYLARPRSATTGKKPILMKVGARGQDANPALPPPDGRIRPEHGQVPPQR